MQALAHLGPTLPHLTHPFSHSTLSAHLATPLDHNIQRVERSSAPRRKLLCILLKVVSLHSHFCVVLISFYMVMNLSISRGTTDFFKKIFSETKARCSARHSTKVADLKQVNMP
jgi:hypothetical protein